MIDELFKYKFDNINIKKNNFNFFDIIYPKEVLVSEWLSFIFNPDNNGIGNKPINKLLEIINKDTNLDELKFINTNTEVSTDKGQRMDIVIKYEGLWIVIENKIDSFENGNQTHDYFEYIEKTKGNNETIYIYLKPNYNISTPKEKEFIIITYNDLINKLKEISEFDYKEKDKYKYLKEFLVSGERFMKNEELDYNEAVLFYVENKDKIQKIENEYNNQNKKLHIKLRYDLLKHLNSKKDIYLTDDDISVSPRNYIQYFKDNWNNQKHNSIHFEIVFKSDKILSNKLEADVVLHIEGAVTEEELNKFKQIGITKNRSLAYHNNKPVSYKVDLDFSSKDKYNESLIKIENALDKLVNEYEHIIDNLLK